MTPLRGFKRWRFLSWDNVRAGLSGRESVFFFGLGVVSVSSSLPSCPDLDNSSAFFESGGGGGSVEMDFLVKF